MTYRFTNKDGNLENRKKINGKNNAGVLPSTSINSQKAWQHRQQSSFSRGSCSDFLVQFMAGTVLLEPTMPGRRAGQVAQERLWSRGRRCEFTNGKEFQLTRISVKT